MQRRVCFCAAGRKCGGFAKALQASHDNNFGFGKASHRLESYRQGNKHSSTLFSVHISELRAPIFFVPRDSACPSISGPIMSLTQTRRFKYTRLFLAPPSDESWHNKWPCPWHTNLSVRSVIYASNSFRKIGAGCSSFTSS